MHNFPEASRKFKATRPINAAKIIRFKPYEMPDKLVPLINVDNLCNLIQYNLDPAGVIFSFFIFSLFLYFFLYFLSAMGKQNWIKHVHNNAFPGKDQNYKIIMIKSKTITSHHAHTQTYYL